MVKGGTKAEEKQNGVSWARYLGLKNEPEPRWGFIRNRLIIQRIISLSPSTILLENFRLLVLQLVNLYLVVVTFSCLWQRLLEINIWIFLGWTIPIIAKIGKFHICMNRDTLGVSLLRLFTSFLLFLPWYLIVCKSRRIEMKFQSELNVYLSEISALSGSGFVLTSFVAVPWVKCLRLTGVIRG